jgi:hypothetical protein
MRSDGKPTLLEALAAFQAAGPEEEASMCECNSARGRWLLRNDAILAVWCVPDRSHIAFDVESLQMFCSGATSFFVITDENRCERYGCCVALPTPHGPPLVLCCVCPWPFFHQMHALLHYVVTAAPAGGPTLRSAVGFVTCGVPAPPRGVGAVQLVIESQSLVLCRPPLNAHPCLLDDWTASMLLRVLPPSSLLQVVSCMLSECKIVVIVPDSGEIVLTPLCVALRALVWPFQWEHTFIPVVPVAVSFDTLITAPCPIFVGTTASRAACLDKSVPSDLVLVDLCKRSVCVGDAAKAQCLTLPPEMHRTALLQLRKLEETLLDDWAKDSTEAAFASLQSDLLSTSGPTSLGSSGPRSDILLSTMVQLWIPLVQGMDPHFILQEEAEENAEILEIASSQGLQVQARTYLGGGSLVLDVHQCQQTFQSIPSLLKAFEALLPTQTLSCYCDRRGALSQDNDMEVSVHCSPSRMQFTG